MTLSIGLLLQGPICRRSFVLPIINSVALRPRLLTLRLVHSSPSPAQEEVAGTAKSTSPKQSQPISQEGGAPRSPSPMASAEKKKPPPLAEPRPSASVLVVSPTNQILLLQRVKQSSSFPSAHVFPGGNLSAYHDYIPTSPPSPTSVDPIPPPDSPARHADGPAYRLAAIRETFEESGLLLARNNGFGRLIEVSTAEREAGRRDVHGDRVPFPQWLARHGGRADVDGLIPFTRWITPTNVPRRFTTQMYLYFLPTRADDGDAGDDGGAAAVLADGTTAADAEDADAGVQIPTPTTDGGLEHTTARFLPASAWCRLAQEGRVILFPPQFYLLHLVAQHLDALRAPADYASVARGALPRAELEARRRSLLKFVREGGDPPWADVCISPTHMAPRGGGRRKDGRQILALHRPGPELERVGSKRGGPKDQVVLVAFSKEGPRRVAVVSREEALTDTDVDAKL